MDERKQYIELETIKRHIRRLIQDPWNHQAAPASWADAYRQMIDILDDEPAADVRHVKRGEWERRLDTRFGPKLNDIIICSNCKVAFSTEDMFRRSFCPNCGADMRTVTDDGQ